MIYRLTHTTAYQYSGAVSLSHHLLRLRPRDLPHQRCFHHELQIEPRPDVLCGHLDYFGNPTTFVTIERWTSLRCRKPVRWKKQY